MAVGSRILVRPAGAWRSHIDFLQPFRLEYEVAIRFAEADSELALHYTQRRRPLGTGTMPIVGNLLNSPPCFCRRAGRYDRGHTDVAGSEIAKLLADRAIPPAPRQEEIIPNPWPDWDLARPLEPALAVRLEYCAKISLYRHYESTDETTAPFQRRKPC